MYKIYVCYRIILMYNVMDFGVKKIIFKLKKKFIIKIEKMKQITMIFIKMYTSTYIQLYN